MDQVEVEITGMVITQRYGTLNTGDILRTDADFARHLVEEAQGAKYTRPKPVTATAAVKGRKAASKPGKTTEEDAEPSVEGALQPAEAGDQAATDTKGE